MIVTVVHGGEGEVVISDGRSSLLPVDWLDVVWGRDGGIVGPVIIIASLLSLFSLVLWRHQEKCGKFGWK